MLRTVVPGGPHPCTGRSELFLRPVEEPKPARREREAEAKAICATCDAREACLEAGLANRVQHGARVDVDIYGGMTVEERVDLIRRLHPAAS